MRLLIGLAIGLTVLLSVSRVLWPVLSRRRRERALTRLERLRVVVHTRYGA